MADLNTVQSAGVTMVVGSSSTGVEQTPVQSTANGELRSTDIFNGSATNGAITVGTTAVAARVGAANLTNRKELFIFNNSNDTLYFGFTTGVTTANGVPIFKGQAVSLRYGPAITVYLIATTAGNNVRVTESA